MKVRTLKRRHDARTLHRWHFLADLRAEMMIEDWQWEPCEDWEDDDSCDGPATGPDTHLCPTHADQGAPVQASLEL